MTDMDKVIAHCQWVFLQTEVISDACAKTIATLYMSPGEPAGVVFAQRGEMPESDGAVKVFRALFGKPCNRHAKAVYPHDGGEMLAMLMFGMYLVVRERNNQLEPIEGWGNLWLK